MASVIVYATHICPYCQRALRLLKNKGVAAEVIWVDEQPQRREEMRRLAHGRHTVPQIFINGSPVGGCDDLYALDRRGDLDTLLHD